MLSFFPFSYFYTTTISAPVSVSFSRGLTQFAAFPAANLTN